MTSKMNKLGVDKMLAGVLCIALVLASVTAIIGARSLESAKASVEFLDEASLEPAIALKQISDNYTVLVIDAVNKANEGLYTQEQLLGDLNTVLVESGAAWRELSAELIVTHPAHTPAIEAANSQQLIVEAELQRLVIDVEEQGLTVVDRYDGELYDLVDPLTGTFSAIFTNLGIASEQTVHETEADASSATRILIVILVATFLILGAGGGALVILVRRNGRLEASVATEASRVNQIVESADLAMLFVDTQGVTQFMNPAMSQLFGHVRGDLLLGADEMVGKLVTSIHTTGSTVAALCQEAPADGSIEIGHETFDITSAEILNADGARIGALTTWISATEALKAKVRETQQAAQMTAIVDEVRNKAAELTRSSELLGGISVELASGAEETAAQASGVASASDQASLIAKSVADSVEELKSSIQEISAGATGATHTASEAVAVATETRGIIEQLGESSAEIGKVIELISSIAEDTNVLALNATIEAARAGEAGKGFAVVANEVKGLAGATASATEDIKTRIERIQADSEAAVDAITRVAEVVDAISETQQSIAAAVEEQTATTNEISTAVNDVAKASEEINQNITGVATASNQTSSSASETQTAAAGLADLASELTALAGV